MIKKSSQINKVVSNHLLKNLRAINLKATCNSIKTVKRIYKLEHKANEIKASNNLLLKMIMIITL